MKRDRMQPKHGETHLEIIPAQTTRRRWCGICKSWTWESYGGIFRHGKGLGAFCEGLRMKAKAAKATGGEE